MKSLIVDFHAGCIQAIADAVIPNAPDFEIVSFSSHNFLIKDLLRDHKPSSLDLFLVKYYVFGIKGVFFQRFRNIKYATIKRKTIPWVFGSRYLNVWIAFPPAMYQNLLLSRISQKLTILISHRMDLWIPSQVKRKNYWEKVRKDVKNSRLQIVSASKYDSEYMNYYSGVVTSVLTPPLTYVNNLLVKSRPPLIGPSNVDVGSYPIQEIQKKIGLPLIKEFYKHYTFEDLSRHSAFVVLPYSIYSISILELAMTGATLLIPSDRFLLDSKLLHDVKLYPHYTKKSEDEAHAQSQLKVRSPNCYCNSCSLYWLQFAIWKEFPNVLYWDDLDELSSLIQVAASSTTEIEEYRSEKKKKFDEFVFERLQLIQPS